MMANSDIMGGMASPVPLITLVKRASARYPGDDAATADYLADLIAMSRQGEDRSAAADELAAYSDMLAAAARRLRPASQRARRDRTEPLPA